MKEDRLRLAFVHVDYDGDLMEEELRRRELGILIRNFGDVLTICDRDSEE